MVASSSGAGGGGCLGAAVDGPPHGRSFGFGDALLTAFAGAGAGIGSPAGRTMSGHGRAVAPLGMLPLPSLPPGLVPVWILPPLATDGPFPGTERFCPAFAGVGVTPAEAGATAAALMPPHPT